MFGDGNTMSSNTKTLSVKAGGCGVVVRACFAVSGPGWLTIIDGEINF